MEDHKQKLAQISKRHHCQNCGKTDPVILDYGSGEGEAFTECCHESVCKGNKNYTFGNDEISIEACCWAVAELKFKINGVDVLRQKGMRRFDITDFLS